MTVDYFDPGSGESSSELFSVPSEVVDPDQEIGAVNLSDQTIHVVGTVDSQTIDWTLAPGEAQKVQFSSQDTATFSYYKAGVSIYRKNVPDKLPFYLFPLTAGGLLLILRRGTSSPADGRRALPV